MSIEQKEQIQLNWLFIAFIIIFFPIIILLAIFVILIKLIASLFSFFTKKSTKSIEESVPFYKKIWKSLKLTSDSLDKQNLFWIAIITPIIYFVIIGVIAWFGTDFNINYQGFNKFLEISKLPLGILALSPIFGVIVSNVHRTIQTEEQIKKTKQQIEIAKEQFNLVRIKNNQDLFYSHYKYVTEKIADISESIEPRNKDWHLFFINYHGDSFYIKNKGENRGNIKINNKNKFYSEIFLKKRNTSNFEVEVSIEFIKDLNEKVKILTNSLDDFHVRFKYLKYEDSKPLIFIYANSECFNIEDYLQDLLYEIENIWEFLDLNSSFDIERERQQLKEKEYKLIMDLITFGVKFNDITKIRYSEYIKYSNLFLNFYFDLYDLIISLEKIIKDVYYLIINDSLYDEYKNPEINSILKTDESKWKNTSFGQFYNKLLCIDDIKVLNDWEHKYKNK
ncbi:hypothetical protein ACIPUA_22500 [Providencia sp. AGC89]|nr:hypothetical protein [Providencia rettgeri]